MIRFLSPWWLLAVAAGAGAGRRLRVAAAAPAGVRGAVLQRGPAAVGRARAASARSAGTRPRSRCCCRCCCWRWRWPGRRSTPRSRWSGPRSCSPSTSRCRCRPHDVAPTRIAGGPGRRPRTSCSSCRPSSTSGLVSFAKSANVVVSPTKDHAAVVSGHRRAAAGRGDRHRRGGLHLPGRDRRRCPPTGPQGAPPARIVLLSDGYRTFGRSIEDAAAAASDGQRAGLDDRLRHRRGHRRDQRPAAAGAGGPAGAGAAGRVDPGLLLRGGHRPRRCSRCTRTWAARSATARWPRRSASGSSASACFRAGRRRV